MKQRDTEMPWWALVFAPIVLPILIGVLIGNKTKDEI